MTYADFKKWFNERNEDGNWDLITAEFCACVIMKIEKIPICEQEKYWKEKHEKVMTRIAQKTSAANKFIYFKWI